MPARATLTVAGRIFTRGDDMSKARHLVCAQDRDRMTETPPIGGSVPQGIEPHPAVPDAPDVKSFISFRFCNGALQPDIKILILFSPSRCGGGAWKPRRKSRSQYWQPGGGRACPEPLGLKAFAPVFLQVSNTRFQWRALLQGASPAVSLGDLREG